MKIYLKSIAAGLLYVFCNYFINHVPSWTIRKALYQLCGMKIGSNSRIMMRTIVTLPWRITIGDNTVINEYCYLDGRGGLKIGNNVNVALYSMLITGTHDHKSSAFDFFSEPIVVCDDVWIAARSVVLNGCRLKKGVVVSAGSIVPPRMVCLEKSVYGGVPARRIKSFERVSDLKLKKWHVFFR